MTVDIEDVLRGAGAGTDDAGLATNVLAEATAYVAAYIAANLIDSSSPVPDAINDSAILTCAGDLFARRKAPFGQQVTSDANGTVVTTRLGADPLGGVRAKLRPWCMVTGFSFPADEDEDS
jgi:hypothetical protein